MAVFLRALTCVAVVVLAAGLPRAQVPASDPAAVAAIKEYAARQDLDAMFALALLYEVGRDVPANPQEAVRLLEGAAAAGHSPSKTQLGLMHQTGHLVPHDPAKANRLFRESAEAGDPEGAFRLGLNTLYAIGAAVNQPEARQWLAAAANADHQAAALALAGMLHAGLGGPKNDFAARRWLLVARSGPDKTVAAKADPLYRELDDHLRYAGTPTSEVLARAAAALVGVALLVDLLNPGGLRSVNSEPNHPFNQRDYSSFSTTKRRQNCRFVSTGSGMDITLGRKAFSYGAWRMWRCD